MRELHHDDGTFFVDDGVADALERLAVSLAEKRMSAFVRLNPPGDREPVEFTLGMDTKKGSPHGLRAKPATGEGSHFEVDGI